MTGVLPKAVLQPIRWGEPKPFGFVDASARADARPTEFGLGQHAVTSAATVTGVENRHDTVAQTGSLPYRRLATGRPFLDAGANFVNGPSRFKRVRCFLELS